MGQTINMMIDMRLEKHTIKLFEMLMPSGVIYISKRVLNLYKIKTLKKKMLLKNKK